MSRLYSKCKARSYNKLFIYTGLSVILTAICMIWPVSVESTYIINILEDYNF